MIQENISYCESSLSSKIEGVFFVGRGIWMDIDGVPMQYCVVLNMFKCILASKPSKTSFFTSFIPSIFIQIL